MGSGVGFLTRQGLHNLVANKLMSLASIAVLSACLILVGFATLFSLNIDSMVDYLGEQNETVVYLQRDLTDEQIAQADQAIRAVPGLMSVTYVSKEEVLETYKGYLEDYAVLFDDFEADNPFAANYRVAVQDLTQLDSIIEQLSSIEGVDTVSAPTALSKTFLSLQKVVNTAGWAIIGALALVSIVVISNTIRLTVHSRSREINIMKFVGATNGFIRWPFFVEGLSVGLISALFSSAVVLGSYYAIVNYAVTNNSLYGLAGNILLPFAKIWPMVVVTFAGAGIIIGGIGTTFSTGRYLEV